MSHFENPEDKRVHSKEVPGCAAVAAYFVMWFAILTPCIMIGWNVGLEGTGIVSNQITWANAFGLAILFTLARSLLLHTAAAIGGNK